MDVTDKESLVEVEVKDASAFLKALRSGKSPEDAALDVGKPLNKLMRSEKVVKGLEDLRDYFFADAQTRKAIVIARNTKIVMEGEDRDATAASRVLALDPDLGFANQGTTVTVNLSEDVAKLEPGDPWSEEKQK